MPAIAVVIPVHRGGDKLRRCVSSLARTDPPPAEIVVVSDGGKEDLSYIESDLKATLLRLPYRRGPAAARNEGVRQSTSEIILFIDADVEVKADLIRQVSDAFDDPGVAAVFGSYDDQPSEINFLSQYRNLLHHFVHQMGNDEASTFWGACGAVRRSDFELVGGFDESRYPEPSIEDVELGHRLRKAGRRIRLSKTIQVRHQKRWDLIKMMKTDFFHRALPWTELILRDGAMVNDLATRTKYRLGAFFSLALVVSVVLCMWYPTIGLGAVFSSLALLILNARFYHFLSNERGFVFALRAIPLHWSLMFLSGTAFALGAARFQVSRFRGSSV